MFSFIFKKYILRAVLFAAFAAGLLYTYNTICVKPVETLKQKIILLNREHKKEVEALNSGISATSQKLEEFYEKFDACEQDEKRKSVETIIKTVEGVPYEKNTTNSKFDITNFYY